MAASKTKQNTSAFLRVARLVSLLFLLTTALDGVNRYLFSIMGKPWVVYIPKFFAVFVVVWAIISSFLDKRITVLGLSIFFIMLLSSVVGLYYIDNTEQVMFGIYMTIPIFLGYTMQADIKLHYYRYRYIAGFILLITVVGLFFDFLFDLPWVGLSYTVGETEITASKAWRSFGYDRLAGFTRASTSAAAIIVLTAIYLIVISKSLSIKLIVWFGGAIAIVLTTSKGLIVAYLIITLFLFTHKILPRQLWGFGVVSLVLVGMILPVSYLFVEYIADSGQIKDLDLLYSMRARLASTWPEIWTMF